MLDNPAFHLDSPLTSSCIFVVLFPILFYSTQVPKRSVSESDKLARDRRVRAAKIAATATGGVVIGVLTAGVGLLGEFGSAFLPKNKKVYINKKRGGVKSPAASPRCSFCFRIRAVRSPLQICAILEMLSRMFE